MKKNILLSYLLVVIQASSSISLVISVSFEDLLFFPLFLVISGVVLGIYAILSMKMNNFQVLPDVMDKAKLVIVGPYHIIRHPMYTGLLVISLGLLITDVTPLRVGLYCILLLDLLIKLRYEEMLLRQRFKDYSTYIHKTYRLIPFVY